MTRPVPPDAVRPAWVPWLRWAVLLAAATAVVVWSPHASRAQPSESPSAAGGDIAADGAALFAKACVSCHGDQGQGTDRGPTLRGEGAAAADFVLTTGRMPLAEPHRQARRKEPIFSPEQIKALTAHVATFGGPAIPTVDLSLADESKGGELFRLNCAGCHSASGAGGVLGAGWAAPDLRRATDVQIAEAMIVGPGRMPAFDQFDDTEVASVVAHVKTLQPPASRGGFGLGFVGPVAEGFIGWVIGLGLLVFVIRRIGSSS